MGSGKKVLVLILNEGDSLEEMGIETGFVGDFS